MLGRGSDFWCCGVCVAFRVGQAPPKLIPFQLTEEQVRSSGLCDGLLDVCGWHSLYICGKLGEVRFTLPCIVLSALCLPSLWWSTDGGGVLFLLLFIWMKASVCGSAERFRTGVFVGCDVQVQMIHAKLMSVSKGRFRSFAVTALIWVV